MAKKKERNFTELLQGQFDQGKSICVGLDSDPEKIPKSAQNEFGAVQATMLDFNTSIIDATKDIICAEKPNIAFYSAEKVEGILALKRTIEYSHEVAPDVPVILDAKRADIGNTNLKYVAEVFDFLNADAVTVNGYFGGEALAPFLEQKNKGIIVLCRTSNPGAGEFQDLVVEDGLKVYQHVARNFATKWNYNGNCLLVVGATNPEELAEVRADIEDRATILSPGVGTQGGDHRETVVAGMDSKGQGLILNMSRGAIFASDGPDFPEATRQVVLKAHDNGLHFRDMELKRRQP